MVAKMKVVTTSIMSLLVIVGLGSEVPGAAPAGEGSLEGVPSVRKIDAGYEVSFEVSRPTDVTVRIVDADGKVVRHFASGMVGLAKAAKPFQAASLSQKIAWDGKDDTGGDAPAGCKVTVAAGMSAKFDKFIIWEKDACPRSRGSRYYAADNGEVYVNQSAGVHVDTMRVFDAEGKLIRQAWPPTLNRSKEAVQELLASRWGATDWDGNSVPIKICHNSWYLVGVRTGAVTRTTDGYLVGRFKGVGGGIYVLNRNDYLTVMKWKPPWFVRAQTYKSKWNLGNGTDGDFYITDDYHHIVARFRAKGMKPIDSFTHNGKEKLDRPRYYLGEMGKPGDDQGHFKGPNGVALDEEGNICVLDGEKVKVYTKSGEFVREAGKDAFPTDRPIPAAVKGGEKDPRALCFPQFLKVRADGKLLIMNKGAGKRVIQTDIDGKETKVFPLRGGGPYHGYSCYDTQSNWYAVMTVRKQPQQIWKLTPDGKRAKFGDKDAIIIAQEGDPFTLSKGISVSKSGDIYVVVQTDKWKTKPPAQTGGVKFGDLSARGEAACQTRVDVYRPDGTLKTKGIVKSVGINDVAVDREGNIYIIEGTMWHGAQMGGVASGRRIYGKQHWPFPYLTPEQAALDPKTQSNKRYSLLCRLVKFSPEGGILDDPAGGNRQVWDYAGVSGISPWNCDAECPAAQIHLDSDERLWVPDSFMYCIKALDKAGNEMIRIGKYGNEDCTGGGGDKRHPELPNVVIDPEIPLSYPKGIAIHGDYLLISDMFSHRVMRCRLQYAQTEEAPLN